MAGCDVGKGIGVVLHLLGDVRAVVLNAVHDVASIGGHCDGDAAAVPHLIRGYGRLAARARRDGDGVGLLLEGDGDGLIFRHVGKSVGAVRVEGQGGAVCRPDAVHGVAFIGGHCDGDAAAVLHLVRRYGHITARAAHFGGDGVGQLLEGDGNGAVPFDGVGVGAVFAAQSLAARQDGRDLVAAVRLDGEGEGVARPERGRSAVCDRLAVKLDRAARADAGGDGVDLRKGRLHGVAGIHRGELDGVLGAAGVRRRKLDVAVHGNLLDAVAVACGHGDAGVLPGGDGLGGRLGRAACARRGGDGVGDGGIIAAVIVVIAAGRHNDDAIPAGLAGCAAAGPVLVPGAAGEHEGGERRRKRKHDPSFDAHDVASFFCPERYAFPDDAIC